MSGPAAGPAARGAGGDQTPEILAYGEAALLVMLGEDVSIRLARRARALAGAIEALRDADTRYGMPVAAAASVLVTFDPLELDPVDASATLRRLVADLPADPGPDPGAREQAVPVRYGGEDGPDLETVAAELDLTPAQVVELHAGAAWEVLFLGFAPGFPYLGVVPDGLVVPRLVRPRTRVPAGSVGIAGRLSGIYPGPSAGGWRLLGRTDLRLFDPTAGEPARLRPGDRVRFSPA